MRVGIAQINPTLGHFNLNKEKILQSIEQAQDRKCELVVFPECSLMGYHPFDLLERPELVNQQLKFLKEISEKIPRDLAVIFGLITKNTAKKGRPFFNSAVLLVQGKKPRFFHKQILPTGDVFDEGRFFESGDLSKNYFTWKGRKFFLTICEDMWGWPDKKGHSIYKENPLAQVKRQKIDLVINLSASPYFIGKMKQREYLAHKTAQFFKAPLMYVNLIGAQDEMIYDGASFVMTPAGKKILKCESFHEDFNVFDLKSKQAWHVSTEPSSIEHLRRALVLGIKDFCEKTRIQKVHFGLSGGIDSALIACLAVDALGADAVTAVGLPGPFNEPLSLSLAEKLAENLSIQFLTVEIKSIYESVLKEIEKNFQHHEFSVVNENLQSRIRGLILMAFSNKNGSLLLTTGNKSEYATGYATLYGDMCGGLAPLGDLTKKQIYQLAEYYNSERELIPKYIITRAPSAELRPNQKDQDSLPEYDLLDKTVEKMVENSAIAKTDTDNWLLNTLFRTEFKRWQAAPILKISKHSFGRGRRWPIAHQFKMKTK